MMDKKAVIEKMIQDVSLSAQFYILTIIAATIAISGLLLNTTSFVIGAMLISPLEVSIGLLGLCVATLDKSLLKKSLECLVAGAILVLLVTFLITFFCPHHHITPEILIRTRPSIYDLIVATLAGSALGYIMMQENFHKHVGVIIGVGIVTSVLPPLATIGYGCAIRDYKIVLGAFILFFTNICAISLGSSFMFRYLGFDSHNKFSYYFLITMIIFFSLFFLYIYL